MRAWRPAGVGVGVGDRRRSRGGGRGRRRRRRMGVGRRRRRRRSALSATATTRRADGDGESTVPRRRAACPSAPTARIATSATRRSTAAIGRRSAADGRDRPPAAARGDGPPGGSRRRRDRAAGRRAPHGRRRRRSSCPRRRRGRGRDRRPRRHRAGRGRPRPVRPRRPRGRRARRPARRPTRPRAPSCASGARPARPARPVASRTISATSGIRELPPTSSIAVDARRTRGPRSAPPGRARRSSRGSAAGPSPRTRPRVSRISVWRPGRKIWIVVSVSDDSASLARRHSSRRRAIAASVAGSFGSSVDAGGADHGHDAGEQRLVEVDAAEPLHALGPAELLEPGLGLAQDRRVERPAAEVVDRDDRADRHALLPRVVDRGRLGLGEQRDVADVGLADGLARAGRSCTRRSSPDGRARWPPAGRRAARRSAARCCAGGGPAAPRRRTACRRG